MSKLNIAIKAPKSLMKAKDILKVGITNGKFLLSRNSPKIALWGGLAVIGAGAVLLAKQTMKLEKTVDDAKHIVDEAKKTENRKEIVKGYCKAGYSFVRLYSGPAIVMVGGTVLVLKAFGILDRRIMILETALASTRAELNDIKNQMMPTIIANENKEEGAEEPVGEIDVSYDFFRWGEKFVYDSYFTKNGWTNINTIRTGYMNAKLIYENQGYIWQNDIMKCLGYRPEYLSPEGWKNGCIKPNPNMPDKTDTGLFDILVTEPFTKMLGDVQIKDIYDHNACEFNLHITNMNYIADRVEAYIKGDELY